MLKGVVSSYFKDFSPLLMSKADMSVAKGPRDIFQLSFPYGDGLP